jgi:hypothetical protein
MDFIDFEERIQTSLQRKMFMLDTIRSSEEEREREDILDCLESLASQYPSPDVPSALRGSRCQY